ncbi:chemotaxis protein CheB [Epibacterium sp. Ofav1-8]|uniref:chemotaxis protein CheB n=1 Tax=Epibacterium sp. Ofav1-8 TaxID=2917735 RepID=UPI001EF694BD|nr:chemotaxis protein CheB [Epibacterium sp. Ofav1-8]MCG7622512.1 PAS domain-containing protein [Epibacterium sp. Ofav1-8]
MTEDNIQPEETTPQSVSATEITGGPRPMGSVDQRFYIIGVGASAGGLDAIKQLLTRVPEDFPHSFVVIQHLSPDYKSLMTEILGRETQHQVVEVEDDMPVEPHHIYVIPPGAHIVIQGTRGDSNSGRAHQAGDPDASDNANAPRGAGLRFSLVAPQPRPALNLPIDVFFLSLAEAAGERAIGVVLSGTGSDGSRGLRAIKDSEGLVIAQDPETCGFDGMPRQAIATGLVDQVLQPDDIVEEIDRFIALRQSGIADVDEVFSGAQDIFRQILERVSTRAEIDFALYKEPTLKRRIARRMGFLGLTRAEEYLRYLEDNSGEAELLYREFLVGVTNFFRDLHVWRTMEARVLRRLFEEGDTSAPLRIWSVGCSTGEEAYTLAMLLQKFRDDNQIERDFRVYATDVNENAVNTAKQGIYPDHTLEEIPVEYREAGYITHHPGTFAIAPKIRAQIVFAVHDITLDPPYTRTDLIVCRNLLIYLSPDVQARVMVNFSMSLRMEGYLLLGAAETPGPDGVRFSFFMGKERIYKNMRVAQSRPGRGSLTAQLPALGMLPRARRMLSSTHTAQDDLHSLFQFSLEASQTGVCIVDPSATLLKTFGNMKSILQIPDSGFSTNIFELCDDRLRSAVALVMRGAEDNTSAQASDIRLIEEDEVRTISVSGRKIMWEGHTTAIALFIRQSTQALPRSQPGTADGEEPAAQTRAYIQHLEGEVRSLQEMLGVTAQDLGASNEELQTANEELIAANEELQANNEETQSINEELHTVNTENIERISELEQVNADVDNLLETAALGILLLDNDMCIRRFSAGVTRYLDLQHSDVGRPLQSFATALLPEAVTLLLEDATLARDQGEETERELRRRDGGFVQTRVRQFTRPRGSPDGVVITLLDITDSKLLEQEARRQSEILASVLESEEAGYWDWNIPSDQLYISRRFLELLGFATGELAPTPETWFALIHEEDRPRFHQAYDAHVESRGTKPFAVEVRYLRKDGSVIWVKSRGQVTDWSVDHRPMRMIGVHQNVTDLREREDEIQRRANEIRRFAFISAHDLKQPLNTIESSIEALLEELPDQLDEEAREVVDYLTRGTNRLKRRVDAILDFARLQDKDVTLEPLDLNRIARASVQDLKVPIEQAGAEVIVEPLPQALGVPDLIARVLQNLLSNALKYRHPDRPCRITIAPLATVDGRVGVRVDDTGIGIAEKDRESVFELFTRLHVESEVEGSGLGLAMCEKIISMHGGTIEVVEAEDGGSSFRFTLGEG